MVENTLLFSRYFSDVNQLLNLSKFKKKNVKNYIFIILYRHVNANLHLFIYLTINNQKKN
jgi:hypothetical protein